MERITIIQINGDKKLNSGYYLVAHCGKWDPTRKKRCLRD